MIEKTVALAEDESGIVAVSEFDSAPEIVSEENFEQRDFEGVVAPEAVGQGASVAAAAHTMSTLQVFPTTSPTERNFKTVQKDKTLIKNHKNGKKFTLLSPVVLL